MFAILIPVSLSPLIVTLLWAERKAKKLGLAPVKEGSAKSRIAQALRAMDLVGLVLLGASVALILLPLTLSKTVTGGWSNRTFQISCCIHPI